jgi:hypothetical protein
MDTPLPDSPASPVAGVSWGRLLLTLLLVPLSWHAFHDRYGSVPLLSDIDLAIHEFGHMLFMPFGIEFLGETMMILGGSLTQVMFPLIVMFYFLRRRGGVRDVHAAMVCLWWTSINILSVAIYCADSRAGVLMLISGQTGQESDGHDWKNLLGRWGMLQKDTRIAGQMRRVAVLLCVVSIVGGAIAIWSASRRRNASSAKP